MAELTFSRRQVLACGAGLAATSVPLAALAAPAWPTRPVRFVVPFAPGGSSDLVARGLTAGLSKMLGQSVYVENKPGASGNVAMADVAAAADQHTIILGHIGTLAVNPFIYDRLPYDVKRDFSPISLLVKVPSLYVVRPDLPARSLKEFLALAHAKPGGLNYSSAGNGSAGHLAFEYLKMASGTFITHVPYRGTGPQLTDLLGGRIDAAAIGAAAIMQYIKAGRLRCIATGSAQRVPQLPDVPTVAEQGLPDFEMTQWYGVLAPTKMLAANAAKLVASTVVATKEPAYIDQLKAEASIPVGGTPSEFEKFIVAEQTRWKPVIARAKIKPD